MELYVICTETPNGRYVDAADTVPEQADRKARAIAQAYTKRYDGATYRGRSIPHPLSGGPNLSRVYRVKDAAGEWLANVEIYSVWE